MTPSLSVPTKPIRFKLRPEVEALLRIHLVAELAVFLVQEEGLPWHGGLRGGVGLLRRRVVAALDGLGGHLSGKGQ